MEIIRPTPEKAHYLTRKSPVAVPYAILSTLSISI